MYLDHIITQIDLQYYSVCLKYLSLTYTHASSRAWPSTSCEFYYDDEIVT